MRKKQPFIVTLGKAILACFEDQTPVEPKRTETHNPGIKDTPHPSSQFAWVPTDVELPEQYKEVTIYTSDKEILHGWARVNNWDYIHSKDDRTINNVTHWLYIGSPNTEAPGKKDTGSPTSQIASKPRIPR